LLQFDTGQTTLEYPDISDPFFISLIADVSPHTLTFGNGVEAPWALYQSIEYIVRNGISGDIVECGVWSGGSMLLAAHALMHFGDTSRRIYLCDTFAGMPEPDPVDAGWDGTPALPTWQHYERTGRHWCFGGTQDHVREVVYSSGYPKHKFVFVPGRVEDTLPLTRPDTISLLRLDTDFYSSTYRSSCSSILACQPAASLSSTTTARFRAPASPPISTSEKTNSHCSCPASTSACVLP
jgi:O-methyltransferase